MWNALDEAGLTHDIGARAREIRHVPRKTVELPGFHVFTRDGLVAPYKWLVPQPKGDDQDLMQLWEAYSAQQHGTRRGSTDPLQAMNESLSFLGASEHATYFGKPRASDEWVSPAAKIIALAQHFEGQENLSCEISASTLGIHHQRISEVQLQLGQFFFRVTPRSIFSNFEGKDLVFPFRASDSALDELCIRPLRTNHPLAVALMENDETPECALQAASVCIRALHLGELTSSDFIINMSKNRSPRPHEIIQNARALLDSEPLDVLYHLYQIVVPALMTKKTFATHFGNPYRCGGQKSRESTLLRWHDELSQLTV
jgi:hypothetical protein